MRCSDPFDVGFQEDGKTLAWSERTASKEFPFFKLPCGQCIECRLEYARQWAVRCVHEAQMHEKNSFITLTYSDENLKSPFLEYRDFQLFMKKLRKLQNAPISYFVTGEYGEKTKRPHWHAIIFNWSPNDLEFMRENHRGDRIFKSATVDKIWGHNCPRDRPNEIGSVTFESAGYVARYAAKKLVHGDDDEKYKPISKKSSKRAIGSAWLEKYWPDVFSTGRVVLRDGTTCGVPRYYEKWMAKNHPEIYAHYVTETKRFNIELAQSKAEMTRSEYLLGCFERYFKNKPNLISPEEVAKIIQRQKFQVLQQHLKL